MTARYFSATLTYFQLPQHHTAANSRTPERTQGHTHATSRTHPRELKDTPTQPQGHTRENSRTHPRDLKDTPARTRTHPCELKPTAFTPQNRTIFPSKTQQLLPPPSPNPLRTASQKHCSTTFSINTCPLSPQQQPLINSLISPPENRQSPSRRKCYHPPPKVKIQS